MLEIRFEVQGEYVHMQLPLQDLIKFSVEYVHLFQGSCTVRPREPSYLQKGFFFLNASENFKVFVTSPICLML